MQVGPRQAWPKPTEGQLSLHELWGGEGREDATEMQIPEEPEA